MAIRSSVFAVISICVLTSCGREGNLGRMDMKTQQLKKPDRPENAGMATATFGGG